MEKENRDLSNTLVQKIDDCWNLTVNRNKEWLKSAQGENYENQSFSKQTVHTLFSVGAILGRFGQTIVKFGWWSIFRINMFDNSLSSLDLLSKWIALLNLVSTFAIEV